MKLYGEQGLNIDEGDLYKAVKIEYIEGRKVVTLEPISDEEVSNEFISGLVD